MTINLSFTFDNAGDAADFLAKLNGEDWPSATPKLDRTVSESAPWDDDEPATAQTDSKDSADPWADDAKPAKPARAKANAQHDAAGVLFPASGEYTKDSPGGQRTWEFGVDGAPDCDCGYPAARVTGKKGNREWSAFWCPIGFTKNWKDKCKFSEFA
jgi:hypothetical protein